MGRVGPLAVKKGAWTKEEDALLKKCIHVYGEGNWHKVPVRAGLNRCRKSCRLRWHNYLNPDIKRGEFGEDEIDLIVKMHKLLGNRWSLIAGRIPGRTANDIKNQWNSHIVKRILNKQVKTNTVTPEITKVIKPKPLNFSKNSQWIKRGNSEKAQEAEQVLGNTVLGFEEDPSTTWLEKLLFHEEDGKGNYSIAESTEVLFTSFYADGMEFSNLDQGNAIRKEAETAWTDLCLDMLMES